LGEAPVEIAALVARRLPDERASTDGLVGIEKRLQHLPLELDRVERGPRLRERVGRDGGDAGASVRGFAGESVEIVRSERAANARCAPGGLEVEPGGAGAGGGAAQDGGGERAGEAGVRGGGGL